MLSTQPQLARRALDAAPDAMIIIDASGLIRFANRQVSSLFGYPHDEIIGQRIEHLMLGRDQVHATSGVWLQYDAAEGMRGTSYPTG